MTAFPQTFPQHGMAAFASLLRTWSRITELWFAALAVERPYAVPADARAAVDVCFAAVGTLLAQQRTVARLLVGGGRPPAPQAVARTPISSRPWTPPSATLSEALALGNGVVGH